MEFLDFIHLHSLTPWLITTHLELFYPIMILIIYWVAAKHI